MEPLGGGCGKVSSERVWSPLTLSYFQSNLTLQQNQIAEDNYETTDLAPRERCGVSDAKVQS